METTENHEGVGVCTGGNGELNLWKVAVAVYLTVFLLLGKSNASSVTAEEAKQPVPKVLLACVPTQSLSS